VQAAAYDADLATFATALNVAGEVPALSTSGPYTIFAPNNGAFAKLGHARLTTLLSAPSKQILARIVRYHIVGGRLLAKDLRVGPLKTLNGGDVTVVRRGDAIELQDAHGHTARVVRAGIVAPNGVVYVIDALLEPPS
jgi:uncharacterized surface protein with fasciclin (FAS1) repeats